MGMHEKPSEGAERVHLQWNEGWETWQEVLPQYAGEPGVVTFIRATTHQRTLEALREAEKALEYARPLVVSYGHTQGDRADYHAELVAPLDAALARIKEAT